MIRKFLAATAVAALTVGSAHAVTILDQANVAGGLDTLTAPQQVAQEALFDTTTKRTGTYGLRISTAGIIPPGQNVFVTFTVSGGTIAGTRTGAEVVLGTTGAVVTSQTATTVGYLLTTDNAATVPTTAFGGATAGQVDVIEFAIPVTANGCNTVTWSISGFQTETASTAIEGGAAALTGTAPVTCVNAIQATLTPDVASPYNTNDSSLDVQATPAFSSFVDSGEDGTTGPAANENNGRLGEYTLTINTSAVKTLNTLVPVALTDVIGFSTVATFQTGAPAIQSCDVNPNVGVFFDSAGVDNLVGNTCTTGGSIVAAATPSTGFFEVNLDDIGAITPAVAQVVTATGSLTLAGVETVTSDAFVSADVEDLVYNGQTFGPFDWVGDANASTNNVFRITGAVAGTPSRLVIENARGGSSFNTSYNFTLGTDVAITNGNASINKNTLTAIAGNFVQGDVTFVFSSGNDMDVDRLMSTSAGAATVSSFGDGANSDGSGTLNPLTSPGTGINDDQGNN